MPSKIDTLPPREQHFVLNHTAPGLRVRLPDGTEETITECGYIGTQRIIVKYTLTPGTEILNPKDINP